MKKKTKFHTLIVATVLLSGSAFFLAPIPVECPGASAGFYGNWSPHYGDCMVGPGPVNCAWCWYD